VKPALLFTGMSLLFASGMNPSAFAQSQPKPTAPCKVYFTVLETDEVTVGLPMLGLNKPQRDWYKKHGNRGEFAGICYWSETDDGSQVSLAKFVNDEKSKRIEMPDAPLYLVSYGESLVSEKYQGTYQTQEQSQVSVTDESGNVSSATVTTPVTHSYSGTKRYYNAGGTLSVWDANTEKYIPIAPLHNHNRTVLTSASTSLLKDGLSAIERATVKSGNR